jgi:glutathione S-transferase
VSTVRIIGRGSSLFTRVPLIFAHELAVPFELVPIYDMTDIDPAVYAGNPALKLPTLRRAGSLVFGAENICRALADLADARLRIVWPEQLREDVSRNAQELVWHGMAAQVQLVFGTLVGKLPADNIYFAKGRTGFEGGLRWLDENLAGALRALPSPRDLSLFEVTLFCLVEHLMFRGTLPVAPYPSLVRFTREFAARPSAQRTAYRFDTAERRGAAVRQLIDRVAPTRPERERKLTAANVRYYLIATTWHYYRFYFGLSLEESIECARMAIAQALEGLGVRGPNRPRTTRRR